MYYIVKVKEEGPFTLEQVLELSLTDDTLVWKKGMSYWSKVTEIEELRSTIIAAPPPLLVGIKKDTEVQIHPDKIRGKRSERSSAYFIYINNKMEGPYTIEELSTKKLAHDSLVWKEGMASWGIISELEEFSEFSFIEEHVKETKTYNLYFIEINGVKEGPYSFEQLSKMDRLTHETMVWKEGMSAWMNIHELDELKVIVKGHKPELHKKRVNMYFIENGGKKEGPFTLAEVFTETLTEDTMVWKEGIATWVKAIDMEELRSSVVKKHRNEEHKKKHTYFIRKGDKQEGPYTIDVLLNMGSFENDTLVWREGDATWNKIAEVDELKHLAKGVHHVHHTQPVQEVVETVYTVEEKDKQIHKLNHK